MRAKLCILAAAMAGLAGSAGAHQLSVTECVEGSEFIMHAAMSRDNGQSRDDFIGRIQSDIMLIRSVPRELRWFVQDQDDEALLVGHAERVFDAPQSPQMHQTEFMQVCMARREQQARTEEMGEGR